MTSSPHDFHLTGSGATRMADQDVCVAVGEDLTKAFPGYSWDVGCNHEAGVLTIKLSIPTTGGNAERGFLMHISSVLNPGGQAKVRWAGGELLERWGLPRDKAPEDWVRRAGQNGVDKTNSVVKSRH